MAGIAAALTAQPQLLLPLPLTAAVRSMHLRRRVVLRPRHLFQPRSRQPLLRVTREPCLATPRLGERQGATPRQDTVREPIPCPPSTQQIESDTSCSFRKEKGKRRASAPRKIRVTGEYAKRAIAASFTPPHPARTTLLLPPTHTHTFLFLPFHIDRLAIFRCMARGLPAV
jgi:hypothetical protein